MVSTEQNKAILILAKVRDFLIQENVNSYLVGGYVRDALLGRPTRDIDIAVDTAALPVARKVAAALKAKYVPLDEVNEIARVVFLDDQVSGARWHVDFSTIRACIEDNLSHRDFTINAMSVNLRDLEDGLDAHLIDPLRGKRDLEKRLIKAASKTTFQDDPARLLRAVRMAAEYGFTIEKHTEALIRTHSQLISQVAAERVREELCRLLSTENAARYLYYLDQLGLLTTIIPELDLTKGVEQPIEHHWDVFDHSIETVAAFERIIQHSSSGREDPILSHLPHIPGMHQHFEEEVASGATRSVLGKIAALLHDIAKPQTKSVEASGRARFLGHTKEGAVMAGHILQRLRFSTKAAKIVQSMVESHLRLWQMGGDGRPTKRAIYRFFRDRSDVSIDIIILTLADFLAAQGPDLVPHEWKRHCEMMQYIWSEHEKEEARVVPEKLVDGHDLIKIFGLEPGPRLGQLLEMVHETHGIGEVTTREEALALVRRQLTLSKSE